MTTSQLYRFVKLVAAVILSTTIVYGCAQIRKVTYPPEFIYLDQKDVTNKMVLMSIYIRQLNQILSRKDSIDSKDQARIIELLSSINSTADSLGAGSIDTNHLVIDNHIDQFKYDVNTAISAAMADPPNYFVAGQLSGSCVACHQFRKF